MATLSAPVTFQNMVSPEEAVPCQLVFVMALDQPKAQIEMLQEIAGILQNPAVIQSLMQANDFEEVRATLSNDRS
jgi:PTS system galactitol-specific IIA component